MVEEFRNRAITMLVSTTILERGVTFRLYDVVLEYPQLFTKVLRTNFQEGSVEVKKDQQVNYFSIKTA